MASSGGLTISDISASGLGQNDVGEDVSKHNPYVVFELGSEEHKTKKEKKAGPEVSWDESFTFKSNSAESLTVTTLASAHVQAQP